jgi:outer membrane protein TolC
MSQTKPLFALICALFLLLPPRLGGQAPAEGTSRAAAHQLQTPDGPLGWLTHNYRSTVAPPIDLSNSHRLESLMRAGSLYLSLRDAMALALENNLDIEIQRYGPQIADTNLLRARAGGFAAPVSTSVFSGPGSVTAAAPSSGLQSFLVSGSTQIGPAPPSLDPAVIGSLGWGHTTAPQSNTVVTGTTALVQQQKTSALSFQQNFVSGTLVNLGLNNNIVSTNSARSSFSPATTSALSLAVTQHLLQGFGLALNTRQIRIARNNREVSDLTFKAQVIATISAVQDLYWDLVTYNENVRVQKSAEAAVEQLLGDNRKQVEVGTLPPIAVVQAEAEVAAAQQALTIAQTQLLQQEMILKNVLSRNGLVNPLVASAHIIATDQIRVPDVEAITPIQDATAMALAARPELAQFRILLQNQQIALRGTRSELLPTLDVVGQLTNNALAGQINPLFTGIPTPLFTGGYGTVLSQIFSRKFPNYSLALNLNIPLRNRTAQADMINGQLGQRQQELGLQRTENQVRLEVQNAVIGLQQARAQYQAATKQRILEEQTVDAERKKLAIGVSTTYNVILTERDLVTAQSNEVAARSAYAKAKVEIDRVTGQTLTNNDISMAEAYQGVVSRPPNPIPAAPPSQP